WWTGRDLNPNLGQKPNLNSKMKNNSNCINLVIIVSETAINSKMAIVADNRTNLPVNIVWEFVEGLLLLFVFFAFSH
ncbi:MAG TPA: hypothetical protein VF350_04525, partial [Candidatus Bathyarchaeia archaeon]